MLRFSGAGPKRLGDGNVLLNEYTSVLTCSPLEGVDGTLLEVAELDLPSSARQDSEEGVELAVIVR